MLFMIIETFLPPGPGPVYARFQSQGRLAPPGLRYVSSWVTDDLARCFQIMDADSREPLDQWMASWADLVRFEVVPIIESVEAVRRVVGTSADDSK